MNKLLVTSGCSFSSDSQLGESWPTRLKELGRFDTLINESKPGQSNKLIKLRLQYKVIELLKVYKPEEITVGVMWTGVDRTAILTDEKEIIKTSAKDASEEGADYLVPFNFVENSKQLWVPLLQDNSYPELVHKPYYSKIYTKSNAYVEFLIGVYDLQTFLTNLGISYFMSTAWNVFNFEGDSWWTDKGSFERYGKLKNTIIDTDILKDSNYSWIVEQIDFDKFISVEGMWEYCYSINPERDHKIEHHPTGEEHYKFTEQLILPQLKIDNE